MSRMHTEPWEASIRIGSYSVMYYVREPSPGVWNAIGILSGLSEQTGPAPRCSMIVGRGTTSHEAIGDLIARVLSGDHPDLPPAEIEAQRQWQGGSRTNERDRVLNGRNSGTASVKAG